MKGFVQGLVLVKLPDLLPRRTRYSIRTCQGMTGAEAKPGYLKPRKQTSVAFLDLRSNVITKTSAPAFVDAIESANADLLDMITYSFHETGSTSIKLYEQLSLVEPISQPSSTSLP